MLRDTSHLKRVPRDLPSISPKKEEDESDEEVDEIDPTANEDGMVGETSKKKENESSNED